VKLNVSFAVKAPSPTVKVTVEEPNAFVTGLMVAVQLGEVPAIVMSVSSNTEVLLDDFEMELAQFKELSTSEMVKVIADVEIFACVLRSLIEVIVGASLTAFTVNVKVSLADKDPSDTVRVIVDVPEELATGVRVTVQLGAVPPMTIPLEEMTAVLLDDLLTEVAQFSVLSTSEAVNAIALVDVSSSVDLFVTSEIVGDVFPLPPEVPPEVPPVPPEPPEDAPSGLPEVASP
jgi:hypothetical protein